MLIYQVGCGRMTLRKINRLKEFDSRRVFIVAIFDHIQVRLLLYPVLKLM